MDKVLLERIRAVTPKLNTSVANGIAVEHMMAINPETGVNNTMAYIDRLIMINRDLFPEGLQYEGSQMCSPTKHFEEITREYKSRRQANIARNDTYLVKYQFSYQPPGSTEREMLYPRYVLLPYVRDGGLITLNGATYNIAPVLVDVGFSVAKGSIYIPFRRQKLTFNKVDYSLYANGRRKIVYLIWSMIHNVMKNRTKRDLDNRDAIHSTLIHYYFCRYGVTETFKRWAKADVTIGWEEDINASTYPDADWVRYQSIYLKGAGHPSGRLVVAVPRHQNSQLVEMFAGGLFYVADAFPDRFQDLEHVDSMIQWRIILGHMVFGDFEHSGKVLEDTDTHLHTVDHSLDEMTREELREREIFVKDIWELFHKILTDLLPYFYTNASEEASMYNKRLTVLRYVMEEFNSNISNFIYEFHNRTDKDWTTKELNDALNKYFRLTTAIRQLNQDHGEFELVNFPGDNKLFRITSRLVPQDSAKKQRGYRKSILFDSSRVLHASIAEVGQMNNQPKNNPDGRGRLSPNVAVGVGGKILRRPERRELIDTTQKRITRS